MSKSRLKRRSRKGALAKKHPVVRAHDPPWWRERMREISARPDLVMSVRTIEEIVALLPPYPDGRNVMRGRVVARRLAPILELIERGSNGSLGIGAKYMIRPLTAERVIDEELLDEEWLFQSIEPLSYKKRGKMG